MPRHIGALVAGISAAAILCASSVRTEAQSVEQFYKGRTIDLIIGYGPGGGYDLCGRLVARYIGRYIPGQPTVVPQNMPGAGGIRAANYMFSAAPKDGTALGLVTQTVALEKMLKTPNIEYDVDRFDWIGRVEGDDDVLVTWHTSKVKSIEDAMRYVAVIPGSSSGIVPPVILNNVIGTKFKIITGYPGSNANLLNMEKGEVDGALTSWSALKTSKEAWIENGTVNIIVQFSPERHLALPQVPDMVEIGKTEEQRQILALYAKGAAIGKSIFAPPDVPADRVKALRDAFQAMLKDPQFIADAKRANLAVEGLSGDELQKDIAEVTRVPSEVVKEAIAARKIR